MIAGPCAEATLCLRLTRTLSWYIDIIDNDRTQITGNLLVNQPAITTNATGIHLSGGTNRDILISGNVFYDLLRRALVVDAEGAWSNVSFADNVLPPAADLECLLDHDGGFAAASYTGNAYCCVPLPPGNRGCCDTFLVARSEANPDSQRGGIGNPKRRAADSIRRRNSVPQRVKPVFP